MRICVLNSGGSVLTIPRVLALSKYATISGFIEIGGQRAEHKYLEEIGINVEYFPVNKLAAISLSKQLQKKTKDIYLVFYAAGIPLWAAILANDAKVIAVAMGSDIRHFSSNVELKIKPMLWARVHLLVAKSNNLYSYLKDSFGLKNLAVNYWGIDGRYFRVLTRSASRSKLKLPETQIVLSPRAFSDLYSIDLIVNSFLRYRNTNSKAFLLLIGRIADAQYLLNIETMLKGSGLKSGIDYRIDGEIEYRDIAEYFNASDVALSFARSEGFPTTLFELFAIGCPVIIGNIDSLSSEIIIDKRNVLLSEFSAEQVSRNIELCTSSDELRRGLIANAKETYKEYGDIERNAFEMIHKISGLPMYRKQNLLGMWLIYFAEVLYNKFNRHTR